MDEELQVGNMVIVVDSFGYPDYKGFVMALTEKSVEVRTIGSWFNHTYLVKRERVLKCL